MTSQLTVVEHPMLADRLALMRDRTTTHGVFRQALFEASAIMAIEVTRDLPLREVEIETPLETTTAHRLRDEVAVVPVLRAGLGMVDGFLRLLPDARVGHVGVQRDEEEHTPIDYYQRLPPGLPDARVYVLDPMLATGGSAVHALGTLKRAEAVAARTGLPRLRARGDRGRPRRPSRRADLDRGRRPRARRERLHPARPRRRGRPRVRDL